MGPGRGLRGKLSHAGMEAGLCRRHHPRGLQNESPSWLRFGVLGPTDQHCGRGTARYPPGPRGRSEAPSSLTHPEWLGPAPAASLHCLPTPPPRVPSPRVLPPLTLRTVSAYTPYIVRAGSSRGLPAGTWGRGRGAPAPDSPRLFSKAQGWLGGRLCQIRLVAHSRMRRTLR